MTDRSTQTQRARWCIAGLLSASAVAATLTACSSDDDDDVDLTAAPDANWSPRGGIMVPTAPDGDGPTTDDPVPHGWAHTPQGAVLAAINGQASLAVTGDEQWAAMADTILAPGKGKDQWAQARSLMTVSGHITDPAEFTCFTVTDYAEDRAQVLLTVTWPDGKSTAQPTQLVWQGDDWRLVLPDQDNAPDAEVVNDDQDNCTTFAASEQ